MKPAIISTEFAIAMYKRFRDTEYYVSAEGVIISRYPVGGDNRFKKGKASSNRERIVGKGEGGGYKVIKTRSKECWYVHRMVMELYGPECPGDGYIVDHIDENKTNNNISNLQWLTRGENVKKSASLTHRSRKLTTDDADEIRKKYRPRKYTREMLAEEYGVSVSTIKSILKHQYY
jgi:hypothetical protein